MDGRDRPRAGICLLTHTLRKKLQDKTVREEAEAYYAYSQGRWNVTAVRQLRTADYVFHTDVRVSERWEKIKYTLDSIAG